jgi:hypothetical protein
MKDLNYIGPLLERVLYIFGLILFFLGMSGIAFGNFNVKSEESFWLMNIFCSILWGIGAFLMKSFSTSERD